jgi:capsule polysaccharide export protein KpsC/LpsZ
LDLVVKLHPKEVHGLAPGTLQAYDRMTWRKMQESNLFVDFLKDQRVAVDSENNWDTYELIESAHCVATINSQSGLEAAIRGKPVIVLGEAFYSRLGFTNDWGLPALLDILGCEDLKIDLNKARRFAYIFLEKYCVGKAPEDVANLIERSSKWRL